MNTIEYKMPDTRDVLAVERAARRIRSQMLSAFAVAAFRRCGDFLGRLRAPHGRATRA